MIYRGASARIRLVFTHPDTGALADPDQATVTTVSPAGTQVDYELDNAAMSHEGLGTYLLATPGLTETGTWSWQAVVDGDGPAPRIDAGTFVVLADPLSGYSETADALASLRGMTQADQYPTLTDAELTNLLRGAAVMDRWGREPVDAAWRPSFSLGAAARDGWVAKAGKVATAVTASDGSLSVNRSDLIDHCMAMADRYGARVVGSIPLHGTRWDPRLPIFNQGDLVPVGAHDRGAVIGGAWPYDETAGGYSDRLGDWD